MPFASKRQQRAAFGGHIPGFSREKAKEWADKTNFKKLPDRAPSRKGKPTMRKEASRGGVIAGVTHNVAKVRGADDRRSKHKRDLARMAEAQRDPYTYTEYGSHGGGPVYLGFKVGAETLNHRNKSAAYIKLANALNSMPEVPMAEKGFPSVTPTAKMNTQARQTKAFKGIATPQQISPPGPSVQDQAVNPRLSLHKAMNSKMAAATPDVDAFNAQARQARYRAARARGAQEKDLWNKWHQGGRKERDLEPLMGSLENVIQRKARTYGGTDYGGAFPRSAVESQLRQAALKGIQTYDPNRGVKLTTHVHNQFGRISDFVANNRNVARIPKTRFHKHQEFQNAHNELQQELGREPSTSELHQRLGWKNVNDVKRMGREIRTEHFYQHGGEQDESDTGAYSPSQVRSLINLMPQTLSNDSERKMFDALFPVGNNPRSVKDAARMLGVPQSRVFAFRAKVYNKLEPELRKL